MDGPRGNDDHRAPRHRADAHTPPRLAWANRRGIAVAGGWSHARGLTNPCPRSGHLKQGMETAKGGFMIRTRSALHYGWILLIAVVFVMLAGSGVRAVFGVFIKPIEAEFGWTRQQLSGAAALSLFVLGAVGPAVGWLADTWGPRRVMLLSSVVLGVGTVLASFVGHLWQLYASAGVLMAMGSGGLGMATSSSIAARWFVARRGLILGILGGAMSAGQMLVVPLSMILIGFYGWRASFLWLGVGGRSHGHARFLAPRRDLLRVRLYLQRPGAHASHPARGGTRLLGDTRGAGPRPHGRHEHRGHHPVRLDLRSLRSQGPSRLLLRRARAVADLPPLRVERALAAHLRGHLRPQLHLHRSPHHHAHRQHLRPSLRRRTLRLDLLLTPGRLRHRSVGGRGDLRRYRLLLVGLSVGR